MKSLKIVCSAYESSKVGFVILFCGVFVQQELQQGALQLEGDRIVSILAPGCVPLYAGWLKTSV